MSDTAWETLLSDQIRDNGRLFYQLAYGVLRDRSAAEDACQQAFLQAWQERGRIQSHAALKGWVARTVINASLQVVRRGKIERRVIQNQARSAPDSDPHPGEGAEMREAVVNALAQLPETTRMVVAMRVLQGMQGNEVKELLGCSAAEVSRQLHRGLEQLRGLLADCQAGPVG